MIHIQTLDGCNHQTIHVQETDIKYTDLLKYISSHNKINEINEYKKYDEYDECYHQHYKNDLDIFIQNESKLLHNGIPINLDDNIDFNKVLTIIFNDIYYYTPLLNTLVHELLPLDKSLQNVANQTEEICKKYINENPFTFIFVREQTEELCKFAITIEWQLIRYVKNKTDEICHYAINIESKALKFIKNKSDEFYILVMHKTPENFKYIQDKNNNICNHAIDICHQNMRFIQNSTKEFCEWAFKKNHHVIEYIPEKYVTYEMCNLAFIKIWKKFTNIPKKMRTFKMCKTVLECNFREFKNMSNKMKKHPELCKIAIEGDCMFLEYVPKKKELVNYVRWQLICFGIISRKKKELTNFMRYIVYSNFFHMTV
jgi:hypothetical protein